jgi:hypothetical protein
MDSGRSKPAKRSKMAPSQALMKTTLTKSRRKINDAKDEKRNGIYGATSKMEY